MKKVLIGLLLLVLLVTGGLVLFSRLVEGGDLLSEQLAGYQERPVYQDTLLPARALVAGQEVYMRLADVQRYLYPGISLDEEKNMMLISLEPESIHFQNQELDAYVKEEELVLSFNLHAIGEEWYVPVKTYERLLGLRVQVVEETGLILIDPAESVVQEGTLLEQAHLLETPEFLGKRLKELAQGDQVRILEETEAYFYVRTREGYVSYLTRKKVASRQVSYAREPLVFSQGVKEIPEKKLVLSWDYVNELTTDRSNEAKIPALDIYSPTWFDLADSGGSIENRGDFAYARDNREKGYLLWGLVTNGFDPAMTTEFLANEQAQESFIRRLLVYSGLYQLDGINIDFENIAYADQQRLTAFVRKLTDRLHANGLVVSMDVTVPSTSPNWSMVYDRKALGQIVDYLAVMTYDEHWASSPVSGSVASIGWVERGIQRTLELVPAEKVLLGLPFYTRIWEEEVLSSGRVRVTSRAYGMARVQELLAENQAVLRWDQAAGQQYGEYTLEGKTYRVWIENSQSIELKTQLVEKYGLAGVATWRKDFETPDIWTVLETVE